MKYWLNSETEVVVNNCATKTYAEMSEQLKQIGFNRTISAVKRKIERLLKAGTVSEVWELKATVQDSRMEPEIEDPFDLIREIESKYKAPQVVTGLVNSVHTKILSLSDIHFPYANTDMLLAALDDHFDANIVVLNGDILEGYAYSTFEKNRKISPLDEYRQAFNFVKWISDRFQKVIIVKGNHDIRPERAIKALFSSDDCKIFRPDLLSRIANGEQLDENGKLTQIKFDNVYYDPVESWYAQVGKTIFVHPFGSGSSTPGHAVLKQAKAFAERYPEVDCIVAGHTHQIYKGIINGKLLIEQGCMSGLLHYAVSPKADYQNRSQNGYAVIYQDKEGNCDFNRSGPIYLGECLPAKKAII
jgi:predicted phosphodiesterase